MKAFKIKIVLFLLLVSFNGFIISAKEEIVKQWSLFEKSFTSTQSYTNEEKYKLAFTVTFSGPDDISFTVPGFWDGGNTWKVRFAPTQPGEWKYSLVSPDTMLSAEGNKGSFICEAVSEYDKLQNPNNRGFLKVSENKRYFAYADDTPFFWLGGTLWDGNSKNMPLETDFKTYINDRKAKGFTVIQLLIAEPPGFNKNRNTGNNENGPIFLVDWHEINPASCQNLDKRIEYILEQGMVPMLFFHWGRTFEGTYQVYWEYYYKYIIARYQAYNVMWCVSGEYGYGNAEVARLAGEFIHQTDALGHLTTIHPGPNADNYSTLEHFTDDDWIDFHMLQVWWKSIAQYVRENYQIITNSGKLKPLVFSEGMYDDPNSDQARQGIVAWESFINGCAGFTYGAFNIWNWTTSQGLNALDLTGNIETTMAASFIKSTNWSSMVPGNNTPSGLKIMYVPDQEIVADAQGRMSITVNTENFTGKLITRWYNVETGLVLFGDTIDAGGKIKFESPFYPSHRGILHLYKPNSTHLPPKIVSHRKVLAYKLQPFYYLVFTNNNPSSFDALNLPAGMSLDKATGYITGKPDFNGSALFSVIATNQYGSDTLNIKIVTKLPLAPAIKGSLSVKAELNQDFEYSIDATQFPNEYQAQGLPANLEINPETGIISGVPITIGNYNVQITATNAGGMDVKTLKINIIDGSTSIVTPALNNYNRYSKVNIIDLAGRCVFSTASSDFSTAALIENGISNQSVIIQYLDDEHNFYTQKVFLK